jgi:hypothetical protein
MILSSATSPCAIKYLTCSVPCGPSTVTLILPERSSFCLGDPGPVLLGQSSPNGITGTGLPQRLVTVLMVVMYLTNPTYISVRLDYRLLATTVTPRATPTPTIPATVCREMLRRLFFL